MTDVMFKVTLSKPTPEGVKLSSKNSCIVTIEQDDGGDDADGEKLLDFFMTKNEATWKQQFINAF